MTGGRAPSAAAPVIQRPPAPAPAVRWQAARSSTASMLSVIDRRGRIVGWLSPGDEAAMVAAFAYTGATAGGRTRGADMVRAVQQRDCWFRCDCLGAADPTPVLVPVSETHIRRSPHHPEHAEGCPFEMTAAEREGYVASLRELGPSESFRLARAIGQPGGALARHARAGDAPHGTTRTARTAAARPRRAGCPARAEQAVAAAVQAAGRGAGALGRPRAARPCRAAGGAVCGGARDLARQRPAPVGRALH